MDAMVIAPDIFGSPRLTFGPNKRLGSELMRLSKIEDGRWKVVSDYVQP
jgi:branched-chain amino acid transport system substrate-binding protein